MIIYSTKFRLFDWSRWTQLATMAAKNHLEVVELMILEGFSICESVSHGSLGKERDFNWNLAKNFKCLKETEKNNPQLECGVSASRALNVESSSHSNTHRLHTQLHTTTLNSFGHTRLHILTIILSWHDLKLYILKFYNKRERRPICDCGLKLIRSSIIKWN